MFYKDNLDVLQHFFPDIWQNVNNMVEKLDRDMVRTIGSGETLNFQIGDCLLHDGTLPGETADEFISRFSTVRSHSDILFYGLGLAYQVKAFAEQYPDISFSVYEPIPEVFLQALHHVRLRDLPLDRIKHLFVQWSSDMAAGMVAQVVSRVRSSILVIELPAYQRIIPEKRQDFLQHFTRLLVERKNSLATISTFQKRWTLNSLHNFMAVLNTPDILLACKNKFASVPAILVASGPSLEDEIENLRTIREQGLAYIVSVGTALNALVRANIHPHLACTYDPSEENQVVCREVLARGILSIPLAFGSTVGHETVSAYPGPKFHMLLSQDALAARYLRPADGGQLEVIADASTIAVIALQLLYRMGFNPIILVGLNLAYRDGRCYTSGATFHPALASSADLDNAVTVTSVNGEQILTNETFERMRSQLEYFLARYQDVNIINTTRGGASIKGTNYQILDEVMVNTLNQPVVHEHWCEALSTCYDLDHLREQHQLMKEAWSLLPRMVEDCGNYLDAIAQTSASQDAKLIQTCYDCFNKSMERLRSNLFFSTLIEPMNRAELESLILAVPDISRERVPETKASMMEREFRPFLESCKKDIALLEPVFQQIDQGLSRIFAVHRIRQRARNTRFLIVEGDGVLTDGVVYYSASGEEMKRFHHLDHVGAEALRDAGIQVVVLNRHGSLSITHAVRRLGLQEIVVKRERLAWEDVVDALGQGSDQVAALLYHWDHPDQLRRLPLVLAVSNASATIRQIASFILEAGSGQGALYETARLLAGND